MALITPNHTDHSTDKGYQFEFFCDRCGNGFRSEFHASAIGLAGSAMRTVGNLFGGVLGSVGGSTYAIERAVQGPGHDHAFRSAVEETKPHFRQCQKCRHGSAKPPAGTTSACSASIALPTSKPS